MSIVYPQDSVSTWEKNLTYGEDLLLQVRVNDSDNTDLLPSGAGTYNWTTGTNPLNDMGTGDYSVILNTADLPSRGKYSIVLTWSLNYYDSIQRIFTLNILDETQFYSPDEPAVETPRGWSANIEVVFADLASNGIENAAIECNWTDSPYYVTPIGGQPGHY